MNADMPGLAVNRVSVTYRNGHTALRDATFSVPRGSIAALVGINGSGKSTLLKLLGGVLDPILGRLAAAGVDASLRPLDYRRQVVWCGPDGVAFDHLSPAEYFGFLAGLYPRLEATRLRDLAQAMGLAPFLGQRITRLSTGTQRKVAVAAALCAGTPVVLTPKQLRDRAHLVEISKTRKDGSVLAEAKAPLSFKAGEALEIDEASLPKGSPDWLRAQDIAMVAEAQLTRENKKKR